MSKLIRGDEEMKKYTVNMILFAILFGFITVFGIASSEDYNQAVIEAIPIEVYDAIVTKLGPDCSNSDIVREYKENREEYSQIASIWGRY